MRRALSLPDSKPPNARNGHCDYWRTGRGTYHRRARQRLRKLSQTASAAMLGHSPKANSAFVAAMEDVPVVYTRPRDPDSPLVCLDETSKQLLAETRVPIPTKARANLFMMFAPAEGWRRVKIIDRRTAADCAHVLKGRLRLGVLSSQCLDRRIPRQTSHHRRSRRLGAGAKCQSHQGQLALHNVQSSRQTQALIPFNLTESGEVSFPRQSRRL